MTAKRKDSTGLLIVAVLITAGIAVLAFFAVFGTPVD